MPSKSSPFLVVTGAVLLLLTVGLYMSLTQAITPQISNTQFRIGEGAWQADASFPVADGPQFLDLSFQLTLRPLRARFFQIIADDCVERLSINGQEVGTGVIPFCDLNRGRTLNFSSILHSGPNAILMTIQNVGGPASYIWRIAWWDPLLLSLRILLLLGLATGAILLARGLRIAKWQYGFFGVFSFGLLLRLLYIFATPYQTRAYDADGHLEYIQYVAAHLGLPPIRDGWEFYQAPLYYVVTGLWYRIGSIIGRAVPALIRDMQWIAFLAAALSLAGMAWIAVQLFSRKERVERLLFLGTLVALPSIAFLAARVNNDVFLFPLEVFCLAFLLRWWQTGRWRHWWSALLFLILSILTKTNGLLLVPVVFLLLLLKPRLAFKTKVTSGILSLALLVLGTIGIFTAREGASLNQPLVVNTGNLSSALFVNNTVETFTEFNPLRMIVQPYNNPWDDAFGRQYFWEYFFKSAFFGEFDLGTALKPLASAVIVCGVLGLLYALFGAVQCIRKDFWRTLPMTLTAGFLLLGHALHRAVTPHSCAQDFRFSLLASIPVLFFLVAGLRFIRSPFWKSFGIVVVLSGIGLQVALLIGILFLS